MILNVKMFFRGQAGRDIEYHDKNYLEWIKERIYENEQITYESKIMGSIVQPPCTDGSDLMYRFCRCSYSLNNLKHQINTHLKIAYEKRL